MKNYCYECKNFFYDVMGKGKCFQSKERVAQYNTSCEHFEPKGMIKVGDYVELDTTEIVRVQEVLNNGFIAYDGGVSNKYKKLD